MRVAAYILFFLIALGAIIWVFLSVKAFWAEGIIGGIIVSGIAGAILATMFIDDASKGGGNMPFVG